MTTDVEDPLMVPRKLRPGQRAEVWVVDVGGGIPELVYSTDDVLLEAPNWARDGRGLLLNGDGLLWRLDLGREVPWRR
jgi:TolB protein